MSYVCSSRRIVLTGINCSAWIGHVESTAKNSFFVKIENVCMFRNCILSIPCDWLDIG